MIGHFDKCYKKEKKGKTSQQETGKEVPQKKDQQKSRCHRLHNVQKIPQIICVRICYGDSSARSVSQCDYPNPVPRRLERLKEKEPTRH
ncbi:hypothetical protein Pcinc_004603 [Petrolisthes cinctipes]|uniref:Uncharacterized protein n=1 Tax=Petrolisthes cinctipes TaxID=88211 RepID=A0AAE1GL32_PETCI|nr:hypothetical protein Pcinc_004603 [Petrolisthes cinctipes]